MSELDLAPRGAPAGSSETRSARRAAPGRAAALSAALAAAACGAAPSGEAPEAGAPAAAASTEGAAVVWRGEATEVEARAVLAAVQTFFDAMTSRDADAARAVLDPEGRLVSTQVEDGRKVVTAMTHEEFIEMMTGQSQTWVERIWDPEVRIHGDVATVWAPFDFHRDGAFSHCGVDAFSLVRSERGWIITGANYTRQREGCAPSPLGPVGG